MVRKIGYRYDRIKSSTIMRYDSETMETLSYHVFGAI
jgi:hypothetical protein